LKLYPIIYLNEGMRTPEEALSKGVVAIKKSAGSDKVAAIDLLSIERTLNIAKKHKPWQIVDGEHLAKRAFVASIVYEFVSEDIYKIIGSAGVSSFGPLAYQMVMQEIMKNGGWLASDSMLKPASQRVWQKMYELSEQGVYKRKFLGEVNKKHISMRQLIIPSELKSVAGINDAISDYYKTSYKMTNDGFIAYLDALSLKPQTYGWMWAYQLESPNSNIDELYRKGEELVAQIKNITGFDDKVTHDMIEDAGEKFFDRLYGGKASY
jgi:hypothetical protein